MKFTCKTFRLKEALFKVERTVSKQTTLPILNNILLKTENGRLTLSANNLEIAIKAYLGAKIDQEGKIAIPTKILNGFLNLVEDDEVEGILEGTELKIISKKHQIKIKGFEPSEFPVIPEFPEKLFFQIKAKDFLKIIGEILISVAKKDSRQELNGVFLKFEKEKIILATTDSFRLTEVIVPIVKETISEEFEVFKEKNPAVILPVFVFNEIQKAVNEEDILSFIINQNQLFINTNTIKIVSQLISGDYPDYKQVIPEQFDTKIKIKKEELIRALKIATLISGEKGNNEIKIKSEKEKNQLIINSQAVDTGENQSVVTAQIEGADFEAVFNGRYILEGITNQLFDSQEILIKFKNSEQPVMIKSLKEKDQEKEDFFYLVMPIVKG